MSTLEPSSAAKKERKISIFAQKCKFLGGNFCRGQGARGGGQSFTFPATELSQLYFRGNLFSPKHPLSEVILPLISDNSLHVQYNPFRRNHAKDANKNASVTFCPTDASESILKCRCGRASRRKCVGAIECSCGESVGILRMFRIAPIPIPSESDIVGIPKSRQALLPLE